MYFEKNLSFIRRHSWTFKYTGQQLAPNTICLHKEFAELETKARHTVAKLLQNASIHHEDKRVIKAKDDIIKFGKLREQCAVWAYEFNRTPERQFNLGINDIDFFNIYPDYDRVDIDGSIQRTTWNFHYKGLDLVEPFRKKYKDLIVEHNGIIKEFVLIIKGADIKEHKQEIYENILLTNEFDINPDKEYILALGDVVYLGLAPLLNLSQE